jgi:hypothetical protein
LPARRRHFHRDRGRRGLLVRVRHRAAVTLQLKDNIECIHLMCAPGIVAHIS